MKSGGFHIIYLKVKSRCAQISNQILGLNIEATKEGLKSVNKSVNGIFKFQKTLKTKGEMDVKAIFNHLTGSNKLANF